MKPKWTSAVLGGSGRPTSITLLPLTPSPTPTGQPPPLTTTGAENVPGAAVQVSCVTCVTRGGFWVVSIVAVKRSSTPSKGPLGVATVQPVVGVLPTSTRVVSVAAGAAAHYTIGVTATSGAGTVTFSCSGLPAASSCTFSPTSLTNSSANVSMTVNTTARGSVVPASRPINRVPWLPLGVLSLMAAAGLSWKFRAQPRRLRRLVPILGAGVLLIAGILAGCGGGGGTPPVITNPTGTPAGTYTITFTASGTNGSANRTMTLVVQ